VQASVQGAEEVSGIVSTDNRPERVVLATQCEDTIAAIVTGETFMQICSVLRALN